MIESTNGARSVQPLNLVLIKVAARCNLNCTYCYEFNLADTTWKSSPALISDDVFNALLERLRRHTELSGQASINLSFHGGEPTLLGIRRFEELCDRAQEKLSHLRVQISLQTNGTLLTPEWVRLLGRYRANVGISLDGPRHIHDRNRFYHNGTGSYDEVVRAIDLLNEEGVHSFLYALEREMPFYLADHPVEPRVVSPWTGVTLPTHAFVHACFVWFTLARFWSAASSCDALEPEPVNDLYLRAARGFEGSGLDAALDEVEPHLTFEAASALRNIRLHGREILLQAKGTVA